MRHDQVRRRFFSGRTVGGLALLACAAIAACGSPGSNGAGGSGSGGHTGSSGGSSGVGGSSGASSGTSSGAGSGSSSGFGGSLSSGGVTSTCIVGTQGCLCDTTGSCAAGLTCSSQGLCCSGSNCASAPGTSHIGAVCSATSGAASCKPGITIPVAANGNDSCGYPSTSFVESTTICAINAVGGGTQPAMVQVFYNDEHALTLGCETATYPVSPLASDPDAVKYPQTGDPACTDTVGRPLRPVLFVTDISADPSCTAGDLQSGGPAYDPVAVFGTWKSATEGGGDAGANVGTPATADPLANKWSLGAGADPLPSTVVLDAGTTHGRGGLCTQSYGAELRFEVGLISGHSYRLQVIAHDGDQNAGGDSAEECVIFCAGSGSSCPTGAQTCSNGESGAQCPGGTSCVQGCCVSSDAGLPAPLPDGAVPTPP